MVLFHVTDHSAIELPEHGWSQQHGWEWHNIYKYYYLNKSPKYRVQLFTSMRTTGEHSSQGLHVLKVSHILAHMVLHLKIHTRKLILPFKMFQSSRARSKASSPGLQWDLDQATNEGAKPNTMRLRWPLPEYMRSGQSLCVLCGPERAERAKQFPPPSFHFKQPYAVRQDKRNKKYFNNLWKILRWCTSPCALHLKHASSEVSPILLVYFQWVEELFQWSNFFFSSSLSPSLP